MSDWTLGAVKARGMGLEASCQSQNCRKFFVFDLDKLIESVGAEFLVANIPSMNCEACDGKLKIELAFYHPPSARET